MHSERKKKINALKANILMLYNKELIPLYRESDIYTVSLPKLDTL